MTEETEMQELDDTALAEAIMSGQDPNELAGGKVPVEEAEPVAEPKEETEPDEKPELDPEEVEPIAAEAAKTDEAEQAEEAEAENTKGWNSKTKQRFDEINAKAKNAEQERDAFKDQVQQLAGQMQALQQMVTAGVQPRQPAAPVEEPDIMLEPEKVLANMKSEFQRELQQVRVQSPLDIAASRYGDEYKKAEKYVLEQNNPQLAQAIMAAPNPGEQLVSYYRQQNLIQETGGDINAYRERVVEETRKKLLEDPTVREQLLAEMRGNAPATNQNGAPNITSAPSGKSGSTAAGSRTGTGNKMEQDYSDDDLAAMASRRV